MKRLCASSDESLRIYASDGIKKQLREHSTDTLQRYRYICVETFYEIFNSIENIPEDPGDDNEVESCASSKDFKIVEKIRTLNSNPKFIDSIIEGTQKYIETLRKKNTVSFLS